MSEQFNRVFALLKFDRDELKGWLSEFFSFDGPEGTDCYHVTRTKKAFAVGTMTLDDFVEFDDNTTAELADFLLSKLRTTNDDPAVSRPSQGV